MLDLLIIIGLILFIVLYKILINNSEITKIKGDDGKSYYVRNLPDKKEAVTTLSLLRKLMYELLVHIENNCEDPNYKKFEKYIPLMKNKLHTVKIRETSAASKHTSYTINKGQELVFCIRSKQDNTLHSTNDLLYVAIHELAHIGCPELGHTKLFYELNLFLLKEAVKYNIYKYQNYDSNPKEYCGIKLNHTILN